MLRTRVIPCLLLKGKGLIKTIRFSNTSYIGDPINTVKIFNTKEVDELIILDIGATPNGDKPCFKLISDLAGECFMPLSYGGGIQDLDDVKRIFDLGVEKIVLNSYAEENPRFVEKVSSLFGSQSVVISIDVKRNIFGKYVMYTCGGKKKSKIDIEEYVVIIQEMGAGEIFLNSIDRDGTMQGYDLDLIKRVTKLVSIPVIASGGASTVQDFSTAIRQGKASAVAAGSMFVYSGRQRGVLINYPSPEELKEI
jgi:cyclase